MTTALVIGDPHFKAKRIPFYELYVKKLIQVAKEYEPTFIVFLGDTLDTHETVKVQPHKLVYQLFDALVEIAPVYVLIGNHDLINAQQFLTDNHIFNPYKRWENLIIIDKPHAEEIGEKTFVFVPYVPPGRFIEALNTLVTTEGTNWELADCIFAHQEFRGCTVSEGITSTVGDVWDEDYPIVISGHIHKEHSPFPNVIYPGSSVQNTFAESHKKYVWIVDWEIFNGKKGITKVSLDLPSKRSFDFKVPDLLLKKNDKKFTSLLDKHEIKINVTGTNAEFKAFRMSEWCALLKKHKVAIDYHLYEEEVKMMEKDTVKVVRGSQQFENVFRDIVSKKDENVRREYEDLFGSLGVCEDDVFKDDVFVLEYYTT